MAGKHSISYAVCSWCGREALRYVDGVYQGHVQSADLPPDCPRAWDRLRTAKQITGYRLALMHVAEDDAFSFTQEWVAASAVGIARRAVELGLEEPEAGA